MNTLKVRLGPMPVTYRDDQNNDIDKDFKKIHLNCDVYLCDPELDKEYRVWLPPPFCKSAEVYDEWIEELTTLAKNSGLKLVFDDMLAALLQDIKNRDIKLPLYNAEFIKRNKAMFDAHKG